MQKKIQQHLRLRRMKADEIKKAVGANTNGFNHEQLLVLFQQHHFTGSHKTINRHLIKISTACQV